MKVKKNLLRLYLVFFGFLFLLNIKTVDMISLLVNVKDALGRYYLEHADFHLAGKNEQILIGGNEKYVFIASDGSKWLFKVNNQENTVRVLVAYNMALALGIKVPDIYAFSIVINGEKKSGSIVKIVRSFSHETGRDFQPEKKLGLLKGLSRNEVFSFLFVFDDWIQFFLNSSGELLQIDLNQAFQCYPSKKDIKSLKSPKYAQYFYELSVLSANREDLCEFVRYIGTIDDVWIKRYLQKVMDVTAAPYWNTLADIIIVRKKNLCDVFNRDSLFRQKYGQRRMFFYPLKTYVWLCCAIIDRTFKVVLLRKKGNDALSIICSGSAWSFLKKQGWLFPKDVKPDFKKIDEQYAAIEGKLNAMRISCDIIEEKLAISLYLQQVYTLQQYYHNSSVGGNTADFFGGSIVRFFVPVTYRLDEFTYPVSPDTMGGYIRDSVGRKIPVIRKEGADEYIRGLWKLLTKDYGEALSLLSLAAKKGYAVDEVNALTSKYCHANPQ